MSLLTLRGLFERLRAPSQSQKGHFLEKMKLKKWHQNSWHWQKSAQSSEIFVTSRGICQGVGVSLRKGEHFPFWSKMVRTKIKPDIDGGILSSCILDGLSVHVSKLGQKGPSGAPSGPRRVQLEGEPQLHCVFIRIIFKFEPQLFMYLRIIFHYIKIGNLSLWFL